MQCKEHHHRETSAFGSTLRKKSDRRTCQHDTSTKRQPWSHTVSNRCQQHPAAEEHEHDRGDETNHRSATTRTSHEEKQHDRRRNRNAEPHHAKRCELFDTERLRRPKRGVAVPRRRARDRPRGPPGERPTKSRNTCDDAQHQSVIPGEIIDRFSVDRFSVDRFATHLACTQRTAAVSSAARSPRRPTFTPSSSSHAAISCSVSARPAATTDLS